MENPKTPGMIPEKANKTQKIHYSKKRACLYGIVCFAIGLMDFVFLDFVGVEMFLNGNNVTFAVCMYFAISFAVMGYLIGSLTSAKEKLQEKQLVIQKQMVDLEESQRRAFENEKLATIGRLASCVAHEVRNPLGVIRTSSSMILEDLEPDSESFRACEFIGEEVERLNHFCSDLLDYARPLTPEVQPTKVLEVLESASTLSENAWLMQGVSLEVKVEEDALEAFFDRDLLLQVLHGLIINATQAMNDDIGSIELRGFTGPQGVCFEVADNGPGVDVEIQDKLFEPFFTTKPTGTGLGLALASRIVEAHHGQLEVVPGKGLQPTKDGACFRITLPLESERYPLQNAA